MESVEDESKSNGVDILLPPKPSEPLDSECCATGCIPCVFDIYKRQVSEWEAECEKILRDGYKSDPQFGSLCDSLILTPEKYLNAKILDIVQETESSRIFRFTYPKYTTFPVQLGQHVLIRYKNTPRQYTVLRLDKNQCVFDILIKIYPNSTNAGKLRLTPFLGKLSSGDELEMRGPFGKVFDNAPNVLSHLFLIASGTGIAPMYRIIQTILENEDDDTKIRLLFACQSLSETPFINTFKEWSSFWNFEAIFYFSNHRINDSSILAKSCDTGTESLAKKPYYGMKIKEKRIELEDLREEIRISKCNVTSDSIKKCTFVVCGTKSFEKDVINHLTKLDVTSNNIVLF